MECPPPELVPSTTIGRWWSGVDGTPAITTSHSENLITAGSSWNEDWTDRKLQRFPDSPDYWSLQLAISSDFGHGAYEADLRGQPTGVPRKDPIDVYSLAPTGRSAGAPVAIQELSGVAFHKFESSPEDPRPT